MLVVTVNSLKIAHRDQSSLGMDIIGLCSIDYYRTAGNIGEEQSLANVFQIVKIKTLKLECDRIEHVDAKLNSAK